MSNDTPKNTTLMPTVQRALSMKIQSVACETRFVRKQKEKARYPTTSRRVGLLDIKSSKDYKFHGLDVNQKSRLELDGAVSLADATSADVVL